MPDPLFSDLCRDTERLSWAPTDEVQDRGRRRTRRTRMATGLAAVAAVTVVAAGAVALAGRPDGAPPALPATKAPASTATPSTPPSPSLSASPRPGPPSVGASSRPPEAGNSTRPANTDPAVPRAAMLQAADLPDGSRLTGTDLDGDWTLEAASIFCSNRSPALLPGEVGRRGAVFDSPDGAIIQRVTRHSGSNAARAMNRVREMVTACRPYRQGDEFRVVAEGLGGAESVLVGSRIEGQAGRWLFVRQGDLVAQVSLFADITESAARQNFAKPVAARLCAGTDAC